jgi:non-canonical purine NTP pyrophosphatase (RdgB/HAM1 family)/MAF protein
MTIELVLGTNNQKKLVELQELLPKLHGNPAATSFNAIQLRTLKELPQAVEVEETGMTFAENAMLKATVQARHLGMWVVAEDSGLCVDALGGAPGVFSARYAGRQGADEANNEKLLDVLRGIPLADRSAHYECHVCLADPEGRVRLERSGSCHGRILETRRGTAGFGYDPLFELVEYHQSFAELGGAVKRAISHRARALRAFVPQMLKFLRWPLILASSSPRRRQLLTEAGYDFQVVPPDPAAECGICSRESPQQMVARLALQKAREVALRTERGIILGADTVAECAGQILGKPRDREHAREMLRLLRGRVHQVYSGICVWRRPDDVQTVHVEQSTLQMSDLSDSAIEEYLDTDLWCGKAGAFGYQDGIDWVELLTGTPSTVVGLPMERLAEMLDRF